MPIDSTTFRSDLARETKLPLLGEPVLTPDGLKQLQIPHEVAMRWENVIPFLRNQSVRLNEILSRPEIKTLAGDIPEYIHDDAAFLSMQSGLSREEKTALDEWHAGMFGKAGGGGTVGIQSGEIDLDTIDLDKLDEELEAFNKEILASHPELASQQGGVDPLDQMFMNEMVQESEEQKKKWQELLAAAKGNPEMLNTIMGMRHAQKITQKIGKLVEMYKYKIDGMDKLRALFDLDMDKSKGNMSSAALAKFNVDFARQSSDTGQIFQILTKAMSDYEQITVSTNRTNTDIGKPLQLMIQNMKT